MMKQDAALRDSLRRIDEPSNQVLRARVRALAGELPNARQRTILARCDLNKEPHKAVAAELGLSMRQFYRERAAMLGQLELLLARPRRGHSGVLDIAQMELARARSLSYCGHRKAALNALAMLAREAADPHTALLARAQTISILTEDNDFEVCEAHLRESDRFMLQRGIHEGAGPATVAAQRREFLWCSGREAQALARDREAIDSLTALAARGNAIEHECAAYALTLAARHAFMAGDTGSAAKQLDLARLLLHRTDAYAPDLQARMKLLHASLLLAQDDRPESVSAILCEVACIAQRLGWIDLGIEVAIGTSMEHQSRDDVPGGLRILRSMIPAAAPRASRLHFGYLCLRVADLELCDGNAVAALEILEDVRGCIAPSTYSCASRYLLTARARLALNDVAGAREAASQAALTAAASGNSRMESIARRHVAECLTSFEAHRAFRSA